MTMHSTVRIAIVIAAALGVASCSTSAKHGSSADLQSLFLTAGVSDAELEAAYAAPRITPTAAEGHRWIAIVRDRSRSDTARRLAFLIFAERFVRRDVNLAQLVQTYGLQDWFDAEHLLDWTYSSSTPFDVSFRHFDKECGIYAVVAPDELQPPRGGVYFCFVLSRYLSEAELLAAVRRPYDPDEIPREDAAVVAAAMVSGADAHE